MGRMSDLDIDLRNAQRQIAHILRNIEGDWSIKVRRVEVDNKVRIVTDIHES